VLGEGWSLPERTGVWTDGPEASLRLPLPDGGEGALSLEFELRPFTVPGDEPRVVDALLDGRRERLEMGADSPADRVIRLQADPRAGRKMLEVSLLVRNPADPRSHEIEDDRRLGVHLSSLRISSDRVAGR
jgi:hypothetical protein